jgi:hypothetical protein
MPPPLGEWFMRLHAGGADKATIASLCAGANVPYRTGCGFYCVAKSEKVSASKDMIAVCEETGEQVVGAPAVRARLGLGSGDVTVNPSSLLAGWSVHGALAADGDGTAASASGGKTSPASSSKTKVYKHAQAVNPLHQGDND